MLVVNHAVMHEISRATKPRQKTYLPMSLTFGRHGLPSKHEGHHHQERAISDDANSSTPMRGPVMLSSIFGVGQRISEPLTALAVLTGPD